MSTEGMAELQLSDGTAPADIPYYKKTKYRAPQYYFSVHRLWFATWEQCDVQWGRQWSNSPTKENQLLFTNTIKRFKLVPHFSLVIHLWGKNPKNKPIKKNPLRSDYKTIPIKHFHLNMHANGKTVVLLIVWGQIRFTITEQNSGNQDDSIYKMLDNPHCILSRNRGFIKIFFTLLSRSQN